MVLSSVAILPALVAFAGQVPQLTVLPAGTQAYDISDDGSVVVGVTSTGGFRWTTRGGFQAIAGPAVQTGTGPLVAVSGDGTTIASDVLDEQGKLRASFWLGGANWSMIPNISSCDAFSIGTYDLNADGSVLVGLAWVAGCQAHAFRYDAVNGTVDLGTTVPGRSTRANGVNGDGSLVVGWQDAANGTRQGARWLNGAQTLFTYKAPGTGIIYLCGEAEAANNAGTFVVGTTIFGLAGGNAWKWNAATNQTTLLPQLAGSAANNALATDLSEDASIVVGSTGGFPLTRKALIWINGQPLDIKTHVESLGGSIAPYTSLGTAMGVSSDGRTIVGFGSGVAGQPAGWVLTLPGECESDLDGDGSIGPADLALLLGSWGGKGAGDIDGDGSVGPGDLALLLGAWGNCS